jgi:hypothetical protein
MTRPRRARSRSASALAFNSASPRSSSTLSRTAPRPTAGDPQPRPPHVADVALVQELVGEVRPAQHRHAVRHRRDGGVPAAVRHEAGNRGVREDALLRAPAHHAPARGGGQAAEKLMLARRARPDHPEERPRGQREALGQLDKLRSVEGRDAAERNVHDGAGRLRVEPRRARGILRPEAAGRIVARGERADGDDAGEDRERPRLELPQRVAEDRLREVRGRVVPEDQAEDERLPAGPRGRWRGSTRSPPRRGAARPEPAGTRRTSWGS